MRCLPLLFVAITFLFAGCGKKGSLIYPDMLVPEAPSAFTVRQTGPGMKLSFVLPQKDLAGQNLTNLAGVDILKREALPIETEGCNTCKKAYQLFRKLYTDFQDGSVRRYGSLVILLDGDVSVGNSYFYKIVPFTKDGVGGVSSAPVSTAMVQPPVSPVLRVLSEPTEIKLVFSHKPSLEWTFLGYNLYRAAKDELLPFLPINKEPIAGDRFTDSGLERHVTYRYAARMVVRLPDGTMVESALSDEVTGALREEE